MTLVTWISKAGLFTKEDHNHLIQDFDFLAKNVMEIQSVDSHNYERAEFFDFAPYIFKSIRNLFGIPSKDYLESIGLKNFANAFFDKLELMLSENSSGKSGSFFFHTFDQKYMIKTISNPEFTKLLGTLRKYHFFMIKNP